MSESIYQAFVEVIPEGRNLKKSLAKEFASAGPEVGRDAGKGINSGILGSVGKLAGPLAAAFAGIGIGRIIGDSISSAADLEQSVGAIDAVFKGSADQMHKWSSTAATDVGLTKNEFNELGTLIGAQLKNGGTAMDQLAPKTHDLIGLGADLSSMFGGTTADAVGALSSALKGERDPIEKYGVSLNQAKIDAEAAALGFTKVGGSLSAEANQAATLSLIMKQTADAHGNFASEADTLSHKQQVLNALWSDGKARIGTALLPAVSALTGVLISALGPALDAAESGIAAITTVASGLWSILGKGDFPGAENFFGLTEDSGVVDFLFNIREAFLNGGILEAAQTAFSGVADWIANGGLQGIFTVFTNARSQLIDAVMTMLPGIIDGIVAFIPLVVSSTGALVVQLAGALATGLPLILNAALQVFRGLVDALVVILPVVVAAITGLLPQLVATLVAMLPGIIAGAITLFNGLISAITLILPPLLAAITTLLPAVIAAIVSALPALIEGAITLFLGIISGLTTALPAIVVAVVGAIPLLIGAIVGALPALIKGAIKLFLGVISGLTSAMPLILGALISALPQVIAALVGALPALISGAIQLFLGIVTGLLQAIPQIISAVIGMIPQIVDALIGAVPQLIDAGKSLIQGFIDGILDMMGPVGDAVGGIMDFVGGFFPHSPAKRGPFSGSGWSAVKNAGLAIGDQLGSGLDAATPELNAKLNSLVSVPRVSVATDAALSGRTSAPRGGDTFNIFEAVSAQATAMQVSRRQQALAV